MKSQKHFSCLKDSRLKGKPPRVSPAEYKEVCLNHKNEIWLENKVAPSTNEIWNVIERELGHRVKSVSIYSMVVNNRHGLFELITGKKLSKGNESLSDLSGLFDESNSSSSSQAETEGLTITFSTSEFDALITTITRPIKHHGNVRMREYTILDPMKWTSVCAKKLYDAFSFTHAFSFKKHYIFRDSSGGNLKGKVVLKKYSECHLKSYSSCAFIICLMVAIFPKTSPQHIISFS